MPTTLLQVAAPTAATSPAFADTTTLFHLGLTVADLECSLAFYRLLFEREPSKLYAGDYAEFEVLDPPLLLALTQNPARRPGGVLNHVGLRYADESRVAAAGQRLEAAGLEVRHEEQTVCCYGRQTKVWVTDPDHNLWEIYVLFEDVAYSGFGGGGNSRPPVEPLPEPTAIWEHQLDDCCGNTAGIADASMDEVRLSGTFNGNLNHGELSALLGEARRILRPGGKVLVQGLVGDKPFPGDPDLPGLASKVHRIPVLHEPLDQLRQAGFVDLYYEQIGDIKCFNVNGVELNKIRVTGRRPATTDTAPGYTVVYRGPFGELTADDGTVYRRGEAVSVSAAVWDDLWRGPAADQFALLSELHA
jgi:catechol 2,3-dioxygenase-like lactoylglutathione lyase family enzyme